jgi:hypothetical protein
MKNPALYRPLFLCSLVAAVMASACAQAPAVPAAGSEALMAAIRAEVGDAPCDSAQQCHSAAIGAKPCGGPDAYLAWSSKNTDETRLAPLLTRYAAARKQENLAANAFSTCMMETRPAVTCQAGRCSLLPRGFVSPPDGPV